MKLIRLKQSAVVEVRNRPLEEIFDISIENAANNAKAASTSVEVKSEPDQAISPHLPSSSLQTAGKRKVESQQQVPHMPNSADELGDLAGEKAAGESVYRRAVHLLSLREHSKLELSQKLERKFSNSIQIRDVVERLAKEGYLSDERFTECYVRARRSRGFGPVKIRKELLDKGIINSILDGFLNVNSSLWLEAAQRQYKKKYGETPVDDFKSWAKRARFLHSRGFSKEHIDAVVPVANLG